MNNMPNIKAFDDEMLSALADGALSDVEVRQVLARLNAAPRGIQHEAAKRLERHALLGELMRAEADSPLFAQAAKRQASRDVVGSVMQQIATETAHMPKSNPLRAEPKPDFWVGVLQGWRAPVFSLALAVSVVGVMLLVVQDADVAPQKLELNAQVNSPMVNTPIVNAQQSNLPDLTEPKPSLAALESSLEPSLDALPDAYLLQHLAHAEGGPMRNLASNVRLASYERP